MTLILLHPMKASSHTGYMLHRLRTTLKLPFEKELKEGNQNVYVPRL